MQTYRFGTSLVKKSLSCFLECCTIAVNKFDNMEKWTLLFSLIYIINYQAQSQTGSSCFLDKTEFKVGYYGNLMWNNGLNLGAEYAWKEQQKKKGQKIITHQLLLNGSLGFSTNFSNQTESSLHTYYGLLWRRTSPKRWQLSTALNPLGYYRSILPETFDVKGDEISKVKFPGRSYYAPSFAIGIGRLHKRKSLSGWYLNFNFGLRAPYNAGRLPMFSTNFGYRFNFKKK